MPNIEEVPNVKNQARVTPTVWPTESTLTLCNVKFDQQYRDVVMFDSHEKQQAYFDSISTDDSVTFDRMTFLKPGEPIQIPLPYSSAYKYNYAVVNNPAMPVPGEEEPITFYYFVTGVAMIAPNTTGLMLELDVIQTYQWLQNANGEWVRGFHFNQCYVERGHYAVAALDNAITQYNYAMGESIMRYGSISEGLDVGNEYLSTKVDVWNLNKPTSESDTTDWMLCICTTVNFEADAGSLNDPNLETAKGSTADEYASGCSYYVIDSKDTVAFMSAISAYPWLSKGILSIIAVPKNLLVNLEKANVPWLNIDVYSGFDTYSYPNFAEISVKEECLDILRSYSSDGRYSYLWKMCAYPYMYYSLNNMQGQVTLYKPELFSSNKATFQSEFTAIQPFTRFMTFPINYGALDSSERLEYKWNRIGKSGEASTNKFMRAGQTVEVGCTISDFPSLAIVNDEYVNYMASTVNTRKYEYQAAGWNLAKSNAQNQLTYDQAQMQLATNRANQDQANKNLFATTAINAIATAGTGLISGVTGGGAGAALGGIVNAAATAGKGYVDYQTTNQQFQNNQALQAAYASQNLGLAKWAAQGDYETAIAGINATVQDAALTQPSVSGQAGGNGFNASNGYFLIMKKMHTLQPNFFRTIAAYFIRYGYGMHEFVTPPEDMHCMTKFTYWKMMETYIYCTKMDEGIKDAIRGVFEKGVTVWHEPDDIGDHEAFYANRPIKGITY